MRLLDRYVLRNFFEPFFLCFFGFLAIWLIFDLSDNGSDFLSAHASPKIVAEFYLTQLPAIIMIVLPVGLLLALLFAMGKMSRSNEIISMLTAGCSLLRVIFPLIVVGLLATAALYGLNRALAPHAEGIKKEMLDQIRRGRATLERQPLEGHLFRDRETMRTWYVRRMRQDDNALNDVVIIQQDADSRIIRTWYARRATWDLRFSRWILERGMTVIFDLDGNEERRNDFESMQIDRWPETPWRIASSSFEAQNLSIQELRVYLQFNADFPRAQLAPYRTNLMHRFALPWNCFVVVLVAAPLGIVYNRRGVLAGVASAIFIFFGIIFSTNLCVALGKGDRLDAITAAWAPNAVVFVIGVVMLYMRSTNRDMPKFSFKFARR